MSGVLLVTEEWAGSGHRMAALALQQALEERRVRVRMIGGLATASPFLRQLSRISYMASLRHFPQAWEWAYEREADWSRLLKKPLGKALAARLLERAIDREMPEVVVTTHAYCLSALAEAKRRARRPFLLGGVLTDFHVHRFWLHSLVDFYVVPHGEIRERMVDLGIQPTRIFVHGIPVRLGFAEAANRPRDAWRDELGLRKGVFTVLICGGGAGHGDLESLLSRLLRCNPPLQLIAVAGRNETLRRRLESLAREAPHPGLVRVLGYVQAMWAWMGASDAVLTKPGGLTCSEALALDKPLLLYQPLPGPEWHNSQFLLKRGAAEKAGTPEEAAAILEQWQRVSETRRSRPACRLGRPDAARTTANAILNMAGERGIKMMNEFEKRQTY